jgi:hypothetical protein
MRPNFTKMMENWKNALRSLTPSSHPLIWAFVNGVCLTISALLLCIDLYAEEYSKAIKLADKSFIVYDFGTTAVWCVEISLKALFPEQESRSMSLLLFELVLAVYFVEDTATVLYKWQWKNQEIEIILINVIVNLVGYLVEFIDCLKGYKKRCGYQAVAASDPGGIPEVVA